MDTSINVRLDSDIKQWLTERADELGKSPSELMRGVVEYVSGARIDEIRKLFEQAEFMSGQMTKLREMLQLLYDAYREMSSQMAYKAGLQMTPEGGFENQRELELG